MENSFLDYFKRFSFLDLADLGLIYSIAKIKTVEKGEIIVHTGEISYNGYIVLKGLLRSYTTRFDGKEITLGFALGGMEFADPRSLFADQPAIAAIEAVESSIILIIDTKKFDILVKKYHQLALLQNEILKKNLLMATDRIEFYTVLSPEERFLYIQKHQPELIQRVPQKYLASYIGITTVSLSRLKARITNQKK